MKTSTFIASVPFLAGSVALAATQKEFETAAMGLALSANCRASYGDHELFEAAFSKFEKIVREFDGGPSNAEVVASKEKLYQVEAIAEENMFMRGFCEKLKKELLPTE